MAGCDVSKIQIENYQVPSFTFMRFKSSLKGISERFRQFCFFTKRSTLLLEKSRKINFLNLFFIEQHAKLLPFLLMLVDQVKS